MKELTLNNKLIRITEEGVIYSLNKTKWNEVTGTLCPKKSGYVFIRVCINRKIYVKSRVIYKAFNDDFDINDLTKQIDHIDRNPINNNITNLRIVTHQQNSFNKGAKGYYFSHGKWCAKIEINKKQIYLGRYNIEQDAKDAYLKAKEIYHKIE